MKNVFNPLTPPFDKVSDSISDITGLQTALDAKASDTDLDTHIADTANPHSVTKTQVGLSNVSDDAQLKIASNLSDLNNVGTARANLGLAIGSDVQAFDATLSSLASYNTSGILTQTAADTFTGRTITGTVNQVTVTNGNGVSGNPTLSLPQDIATTSTPQLGRIGIGMAADATALVNLGGVAAPLMLFDPSTTGPTMSMAVTPGGFVGWGANRNFTTGGIYDATKHTSTYAMLVSTTEVYHFWSTSAAVNTNPTERMRLTANLKIGGTAARATTEGVATLDLFNGTAPVGTLANGVSLYSSAGELRVMDAGGTATLLSPHDDKNYWVFDSEDTTTGKKLHIDVEKLLRFVNDHFGLDYVKGDMTRA